MKNLLRSCQIGVKFFITYGSVIAMFCANLQNDSITELGVLDERVRDIWN